MIGKAVVSGISLILVVGVIIGIVSVTRPHGSDRTDGDTNMSSSMKAVASVCATADYKDACMQTLSPVPKNGSSATPKDYIQAAVQVTIKQIKSSMNLSEKLFQATNDSRTQMALGDCKDLLQFAIDELQESFSSVGESDLQTLDQLSTEIMNWLSAVVSYQQTCLDGVIEPRFQTAMQKGLLNATQLTSNALAIVSDLSQILTKFNVPLDLKPNSRRLLGEIEVLGHDGYPTWFSATDRKLLALQDNGRLTPNAIVAKDGSGHFTTIAAALAAYPKNLKGRYVIYVKAGIYREYITVTKDQVNVYMYGDGPRKTIVTGTKSYRDGITTYKTATFCESPNCFSFALRLMTVHALMCVNMGCSGHWKGVCCEVDGIRQHRRSGRAPGCCSPRPIRYVSNLQLQNGRVPRHLVHPGPSPVLPQLCHLGHHRLHLR